MATAVTLVGGAIMGAGAVMAYLVAADQPPPPGVDPNWVAMPVYDQSGYLYGDFAYINPDERTAAALGGLAVAAVGGVVVIVGFAMHVGCFAAT